MGNTVNLSFNISGNANNAVKAVNTLVGAVTKLNNSFANLQKQKNVGASNSNAGTNAQAKALNAQARLMNAQARLNKAANPTTGGSKKNNLLSSVKSTFNEVAMIMDRTVNSFRLVTQGLGELVNTLAISVAAPIAYFMTNAFKDAQAFEQQIAKVRKATRDISSDQFDVLTQRIRNLAKVTPTAVEDLGKMAEQAGQIGINGMPGVYRMLTLANKMVVGTDASADSIVEDLGRIAAAFGWDLNTEEGMRNLEKYASVMDKVAKMTTTNTEGLVAASLDAAMTGPMLGIQAQDLAAMLGAAINAGLDPGAAGNVVNRFYNQVLRNADKFAVAMKNYARQGADANGKYIESFKPYKDAAAVISEMNAEPVKVFTDAIEALATTADEDRAQMLKEFMSATGFVGGRIAAVKSNYKALQDLAKASRAEWETALTLQEDYDTMLMTSQNQMSIFQNNIRDLGINLGTFAMPFVNTLIQYAIPAIQMVGRMFSGLDDKTKLLVIGIPLLVVALTPVLMIAIQLLHAFSLMAMGGVAAFQGIGRAVVGLIGLMMQLGKGAQAATSIGILGMRVGIAGLTSILGTFVGILGAVFGGLAILSKFGVDVAKFFVDLATQAKAWGENMMATYGAGLLGGAARVISQVITAIANMIASFFEAHSPPDQGPLSTINTWGKGLMDTYLQGFKLADFDILKDVGNTIKNIMGGFAVLGGGDESDILGAFRGARAGLAKLLSIFEQTGNIASDVLGGITSNLGDMGGAVGDLIKYWLDYNRIQQKIADNEKRRKGANNKFSSASASIAGRTDLTGEQKAEMIRQAMLTRDQELEKVDEEKKGLDEQSTAAKEKLDWQKAYVDALMEEFDLVKQIKKAADKDAAGAEPDISFDPSKLNVGGGALSNVKDLGEEFNKMSEKIETARKAWQSFMDGLSGKPYVDPMDAQVGMRGPTMENHPGPRTQSEAQNQSSFYEMGVKVRGVWNDVSGIFEKIGGTWEKISSIGKGGGGGLTLPDEWKKKFQAVLDFIGPMLDIFRPLTDAFAALNTAGNDIATTLSKLGFGTVTVSGLLTALGNVGVFAFGLILSFVVGVINGIASLISWIVKIGSAIVTAVVAMVTGFLTMVNGIANIVRGLWDIIVGVFTGNQEKISQGVNLFLQGIGQFFAGAFALISGLLQGWYSFMMGIFWGLLDIILSVVGDIAATIIAFFAGEEAGNAARDWVKGVKQAISDNWQEITTFFETTRKTVLTWFDDLVKDIPKAFRDLGKSISAMIDFGPLIEKAKKIWEDIKKIFGSGGSDGGSEDSPQPAAGRYGFNNDGTADNDGIKTNSMATGGIANRPIHALIGEGVEPEAVIPLSRLPALFSSLYGQPEMAFAGGTKIEVHVHNPVVREEMDIDKIANAVANKTAQKVNATKRFRS